MVEETRFDPRTHLQHLRQQHVVTPPLLQQEEINMADPVTQVDLNNFERNVGAEFYATRGDIKDSRHDVLREVDRQADRLDNQASAYYIASQQNATEAARDLASLKVLTDANASAMREAIALNVEKSAAAAALAAEKIGAASALSAEKIATAVALGQSTLSKEIFADGQKTRDLINDLKTQDLNRLLIERNAEFVEERGERRHWRYHADQAQSQGQWAALQSQIQAFGSQLSDARNSMVNFGTQLGVGQRATSNNVN